MTEESTDETNIDAPTESDSPTCPNCGQGTIIRSEACYADATGDDSDSSPIDLPGKICDENCGWFKLDREPEREDDTVSDNQPAPGDGKIGLPNGKIALLSDPGVDVDDEHGTYMDRNACPICGGAVRVYISRVDPEHRKEASEEVGEPVEYTAYAEKCCRSTCSHRKP